MIKENILNKIISDSIHNLLVESQESKSQSEAIKLVMNKLGYSNEQANEFVRVTLRNDITALRDKQIAKFTLGVVRMYLDRQINDAKTISDLNTTLPLLKPHINEYDRNLNGLSAQELISRFEKVRSNNLEQDKNDINAMSFGESNYKIVPINSFEEAEQYEQYTYNESPWCLTYMSDMFDNYTCDGINQIYFCLRNGFENEEPIVGENAPLDSYGLSMLSVIVNESGELAYCTTRWNHENGGSDSAMSAKEISQVVGVNFYEVFKPNNKWQSIVDNAMSRLQNGVDPYLIFNDVYGFVDGFAQVKLNDKWNFIDENGKFLSNQWFDYVSNFVDGLAKVKLKGNCNFINTNGKVISEQWFDFVGNFVDGLARVELNDKYNFINTNGKVISEQWFDYVEEFANGLARVELNDKYNFINTNGKFISKQWFDNVERFVNGFGEVKLNDKWNLININGQIILNQWFDDVKKFGNYIIVKLNGKWNLINKNGQIISKQWFDDVGSFDKFIVVKLNGKYNIIVGNGQFALNQWTNYDFNYNSLAEVKLNNKWNFINENGKFISNQWFDNLKNFDDGLAKVSLNGNLHENRQIKLLTKANLTQIVLEVLNNIKKEIRG